jgi:hypothetical protein
VVHANLAVPWAGAVDLAGALALPHTRVVAVQQLPLRTVELRTWLRTRTLLHRVDAHVAVGEASARRIEDFYALGRGPVVSVSRATARRRRAAGPARCGRPQAGAGGVHSGAHGGRLPAAVGTGGDGAADTAPATAVGLSVNPPAE